MTCKNCLKTLPPPYEAHSYQYLASALHLSATGQLTEQLIATAPLSDAQRDDCRALLRTHEAQRRRQMADEPPAPGQRITAKFKPGTYLGQYGSWHTGTITAGPGGGFSIPGTGGIALTDISEWLPAPDEEPHDVEKRLYWEQYASGGGIITKGQR